MYSLYIFFKLYGYNRDLHVLTHSFPKRRASVLGGRRVRKDPRCRLSGRGRRRGSRRPPRDRWSRRGRKPSAKPATKAAPARRVRTVKRSEEHTSELQSLMRISYAVFCLKKKRQIETKQQDND